MLAAERTRIVPELARLARAVLERELWVPFGYPRLSDFAMQLLGRSARWVRDLAALDTAIRALPELAPALCGAEGPPIGRCAALWIGRTATAESVGAWIELAQSKSARALRESIRAARATGSHFPVDPKEAASTQPGLDAEADEFAERTTLRLHVPAAIRVAFEEALDLHRCVSGGEAPAESFVDALLGEMASRGEFPELPPREAATPPREVPGTVRSTAPTTTPESADSSMASPRSTSNPRSDTRSRTRSGSKPEPVDPEAEHLRALHPEELLSRLLTLIAKEDEIERLLGQIIAFIGSRRAWGEIGFSGVAEFCEEDLGWSRSTAAGRAWLANALARRPMLRRAYESGRIGYVKTLLVCRSVGRGRIELELEREWMGLAKVATVRRMRDELRLLRRRQVGVDLGGENAPGETGAQDDTAECEDGVRGEVPELCEDGVRGETGSESGRRPAPLRPSTDEEWLSSLLRRPGMARERVALLGRWTLADATDRNVLLSLNLPEELAAVFKAALEHRMGILEAGRATGVNGDAAGSNDDGGTALGGIPLGGIESAAAGSAGAPVRASLLACETFSTRGEALPRWLGLLSMLEDYVETHDDPKSCPRRDWDKTYCAAGWRCMAPGCTARANLHNHHIDYRSDQGSDEPWNQLCLCSFHHLQGEHGELAMIRGRGPLDIVIRLGRKDLARWYRNDKEIPPPPEWEECSK